MPVQGSGQDNKQFIVTPQGISRQGTIRSVPLTALWTVRRHRQKFDWIGPLGSVTEFHTWLRDYKDGTIVILCLKKICNRIERRVMLTKENYSATPEYIRNSFHF